MMMMRKKGVRWTSFNLHVVIFSQMLKDIPFTTKLIAFLSKNDLHINEALAL